MSTKKIQPEPKAKIVIDNQAAFEEWEKSLHRFNSNRDLKTYVFDIAEFSFYENLNISTEVDHYNAACGCKTGSFMMSLTVVTLICNFFISGGRFSEITFYQVLAFIGLTLLGALTGKMIGLLHAHWNLIKISRDIKKRINTMYTIKQTMKMT